MKCSLIIFILLIAKIKTEISFIHRKPSITFHSCLASPIMSLHDYGTYPDGEENQYRVSMDWNFKAGTTVAMEFTSAAFVELFPDTATIAELSKIGSTNAFDIRFNENSPLLTFRVKGPFNGKVPYFKSLLIDAIQHCRFPVVDVLDDVVKDIRIVRQVGPSLPVGNCGRRQNHLTELIVSGESTKPGDWPWHVAIYRLKGASNMYICGGTLISNLFVLTAAHCATINKIPVVPDMLSVVLGKYHFIGGDMSSQERKVFSIKVHENYGIPHRLDNDLALLKLMSEAVYSTYVQPACIWSSIALDALSKNNIFGTVVGWGFTDFNGTLPPELKQTTLPLLSDSTCIKSNAIFYGTILTDGNKFCAGHKNGTSPCNGDSGGGFMVYVPDALNDASYNTGSWYIRGLVSMTIPYPNTKVCDPNQYVVFTDISKYEDWVRKNTVQKIPSTP